MDFDVTLRAAGGLSDPAVPSYVTGDVRIGWRWRRDIELSVAARNLGARHGEFTSDLTRTQFESTYQVALRWTFDAR